MAYGKINPEGKGRGSDRTPDRYGKSSDRYGKSMDRTGKSGDGYGKSSDRSGKRDRKPVWKNSERPAKDRGREKYGKGKDLPDFRDQIQDEGDDLPSRILEGRNPVLEAYRAGRTIDRLMVQSGAMDGPIQSILREAKKAGTVVDFLPRERLDQISETGMHQGVIAYTAFCDYVEVEDILAAAKEKGEDPFLFLLDDIEDPHNLGAIIRTANLAGAHGVIIPKRRAAGVTATVARASAGAVNYTPIARVTNLANTIEALKKEGIWFACADMDGEVMYKTNLTGPIGLVIGNEGSGVSRLVKEKCDYVVRIPMHGDIDSLNASVAAGVLAFEIVRQREQ